MAKKKIEAVSSDYTVIDEFGENGNRLILPASTGRDVQITPTGILALDVAIGDGGLKAGTIVTITGAENTGKSSSCYRFCANAQAAGIPIIYWDTETRWSPDIAEANGLDLEEGLPEDERLFHLIQWNPLNADPAIARGTLQNIQYLVRKFFTQDKRVLERGGVFIIDSINAIITAQTEGGADKSSKKKGDSDDVGVEKGAGEAGGIALIPRMMSTWLPELSSLVKNSRSYCIITRQIRSNVSSMGYGDGINFSGGSALKHFASLDIFYRYVGKVPASDSQKADGWERVGNKIQITTRKNTAGVFGRQTEFQMSVEHGPNDMESIIRYGMDFGIVKKSGAYYSVQLANGEWTPNMYASDIAEYFWSDEEHLALMFDVMERIRQASIKHPRQRKIGGNNVSDSNASEE